MVATTSNPGEQFERDLRATSVPEWAMVVEDDAEMRALLGRAVRSGGLPVVSLGDGRDAAALLLAFAGRDLSPALLVTDVNLPGLSGLDLLAVVPRTPSVVISAFADDHLVRRALRLGARAVLTKPFSFPSFRSAIAAARAAVRS